MPGRYRTLLVIYLVISVLTINALGQSAPGLAPSEVVREITSPAGPGSAEPNLYTGADGRVYLSWVETREDNLQALRFAVLSKGGWSEPRTIAEGRNWFVNWADFPSLVVTASGLMAAHWMVKSGAGAHDFDINVARSTDAGKTWSKPVVPHRDGTQNEHGFVSLLPWSNRGVAAVWLDGRNFKKKEGGHDGHGSMADEMTLRFTTISPDGLLSEDALVDPRVCDCCQTAAALTSDGMVVAYRDRSKEEIRDISIVRLQKGRWTEPVTLHADGWKIPGCPVSGPSVAADGKRVAVAWFTAAADRPAVKVAFSSDAAATFGPPVQVDDGSPVGRVDVVMLSGGEALVVWLERTTGGGEIRARRVRPDGVRGKSITIAESSVARASGLPQLARAGGEAIFAWTDAGKPSRVRTAGFQVSGSGGR